MNFKKETCENYKMIMLHNESFYNPNVVTCLSLLFSGFSLFQVQVGQCRLDRLKDITEP